MQVRYYRYPDNPSEFSENLQAASEQHELERAEQERIARQLEEEKNQTRGLQIRESLSNAAKDKLKKEALQVGKTAVKAGARSAAASIGGFFLTPPGWITLGILAGITALIGIVIFVMFAVYDSCQSGGKTWTAWAVSVGVQAASKAASALGYEQYAICEGMDMAFAGGRSGGAGASGTFDPNVVTESEARAMLASAGISVNALPPQTSLSGMKIGVINEIISFANACGGVENKNLCRVIVTGGTETTGGHARGPCSHLTGFKIDIDNNSEVNKYIINNPKLYVPSGVRSDGAALYRSPSGALYALEDTHWDIQVGC